MTERRRFLRFATDVGMEYRIPREKELCGCSSIKNLSREGMHFMASKKLQEGDLLDVKFSLPDDERPVYLTAEVIWTYELTNEKDSGHAVGAKFFKIDNFDRVRVLDHAYSEWLKSSKPNPTKEG